MTLVFSSNVLWLDSSLPENQTTTFPELYHLSTTEFRVLGIEL